MYGEFAFVIRSVGTWEHRGWHCPWAELGLECAHVQSTTALLRLSYVCGVFVYTARYKIGNYFRTDCIAQETLLNALW